MQQQRNGWKQNTKSRQQQRDIFSNIIAARRVWNLESKTMGFACSDMTPTRFRCYFLLVLYYFFASSVIRVLSLRVTHRAPFAWRANLPRRAEPMMPLMIMTMIMLMMMVAEPSEKKKRIGKKKLTKNNLYPWSRLARSNWKSITESLSQYVSNNFLCSLCSIPWFFCHPYRFCCSKSLPPAHCPDSRRVKAIDVDGGTHGARLESSEKRRGEYSTL